MLWSISTWSKEVGHSQRPQRVEGTMGRPRGTQYMLVHADEVPHRQRACQVSALSQTLSINSPKTRLPAECCSIQSWSGRTDPRLFKIPYKHSTTPISAYTHTHCHQAGRHNSSLLGDLYTMKKYVFKCSQNINQDSLLVVSQKHVQGLQND